MPKPLIAIVGRPNVGKSLLFNRLARQRIAVVEDMAGTTRDRLYADCDIWGRACTLIDTGGFDPLDKEGYTPAIVAQSHFAIEEADIIVFLTDGREEPTVLDFEIAEVLRRSRKPVLLAANKVDNPNMALSNLHALRIGTPLSISAATGNGVAELTEHIEDLLPRDEPDSPDEALGTKIALVGRPNVGKSSLTNRILGYDRVMVSEVPGTTRDAVDTGLLWKDQPITLIDTAGMRRKARVKQEKTSLEYHMVLRSLRAIDRSDVVIVVLESGGVTDQDTKIAGYAHEAGKAMLIAINKWDLIEEPRGPKLSLAQKDYQDMVTRYLPFVSYAPSHYVSAVTGRGIESMIDDALIVFAGSRERIPTAQLNDLIRRSVADHSPPSAKGKAIKIRYATQTEVSPPTVIIFVNKPDLLHFSYVRHLENEIRKRFPMRGLPLRIELRAGSGERTKEERLQAKRDVALEEDRKLHPVRVAVTPKKVRAR